MEQEQEKKSVGHPFSVCVGRWGVVPYASDNPCGWVLPGGVRTQDAARATAVATAIDAHTRRMWGDR